MIEIEVDDEVELRLEIKRKVEGMLPSTKDGFTGNWGEARVRQYILKRLKKEHMILEPALVQKPGKSINDGNPMGLAMSIKVVYAQVENEVVVKKSWNENPFGVALTINAPLPPVPTEQIPSHDGPCPPSPFWHTRYQNLE